MTIYIYDNMGLLIGGNVNALFKGYCAMVLVLVIAHDCTIILRERNSGKFDKSWLIFFWGYENANHCAGSGVSGLGSLTKGKEELVWMPEVVCKNRDKVIRLLSDNDIMSRPLYQPLHNAQFLGQGIKFESSFGIESQVLFLLGFWSGLE